MREQVERFPEGVIRDGCEHLGTVLKRVPLVEDYSWMGSDFRFWFARFAIRCDSPLALPVMRALGYALNSSVVELWLRRPFVFMPEGDEAPPKDKDVIYWTIEATEPLLDPKEVAGHLEMVLLENIQNEADWLKY